MTGQPLGGGGIPLIRSAAALAALNPPGDMFVRFQDDTTLVDGASTMKTLGIAWLLAYNGQSGSASKWEFVGGPPLFSEVTTQETATPANAYINFTTVGPAITLPLAGDYDVEVGADEVSSTAVGVRLSLSYAIGATAAVDADMAVGVQQGANEGWALTRSRRKTGLTAVTLTAKYKSDAVAAVMSVRNRRMLVTPVRVG